MNDEILQEMDNAKKTEQNNLNISIRRVANGYIISDGCDEYVAADRYSLKNIFDKITSDMDY